MTVVTYRRTDLTALKRFTEVARQTMLPLIGAVNSCIISTRITIECLCLLGYDAEPLPTKMVVTAPRLKIAYASGATEEEMATAAHSRRAFGTGWRGHLVARVNRDLLVDSSLDQAAAAIPALKIPHEVFVFPLTGAMDDFHVTYGVTLNDNERVSIEYITTGDHSYNTSDAWNDLAVPAIVSMILRTMKGSK